MRQVTRLPDFDGCYREPGGDGGCIRIAELVPLLEGLSGPPFELADAVERAVGRGLEIAGIEIGKTRDLTHPVDLMQENFPYLA